MRRNKTMTDEEKKEYIEHEILDEKENGKQERIKI